MDTIEKLNKISELESRRTDEIESANYEKDMLRPPIPPDVQAAIEEVDARLQSILDPIDTQIAGLVAAVKGEVITKGETVKGDKKMAVLNKRVTYDPKGLDGYAVGNPDVLKFRKESVSVSFRNV